MSNNPINRIDSDGRDDYTIKRKTGETRLVKETEDETDRVLKTNRIGEVKTNRKGESKVAFGKIEKGILSDGMNFKENDRLFEVGGDGKPSEGGIESFALQHSEYVGTEISGIAYSSNSTGEVTDMVLGKYKNNDRTNCKATPGVELSKKYGNMYSPNNVLNVFHTHPDGNLGAIASSSPEISTDYKNLQGQKPHLPNASFLILYRISGQLKLREYYYTHLYRPKK